MDICFVSRETTYTAGLSGFGRHLPNLWNCGKVRHMSEIRDGLSPEQQVVFDQAIAGAGQVYAEGIARQDARSPREAARAALGRDATDEQLTAWVATYRRRG